MFEGLSAGFETLRHTQKGHSRFRQSSERLYIDFVVYTNIYMWALIQEQPFLFFFFFPPPYDAHRHENLINKAKHNGKSILHKWTETCVWTKTAECLQIKHSRSKWQDFIIFFHPKVWAHLNPFEMIIKWHFCCRITYNKVSPSVRKQ